VNRHGQIVHARVAAGLVVALLATLTGPIPSSIPRILAADPTPVAEWTFDETSGSIAHDQASGLDGLLLGDAAWNPTGGRNGGGSLVLDGTGDGVQVPSAAVLEPTSLTMSLWMKSGRTGNNDWDVLLQKGANGCEAGSYGLEAFASMAMPTVGAASAKIETAVVGNWAGSASAGSRLWDNEWHHIAWAFDAIANASKIYVDGIPTNGQAVPILYGLPSSSDLFIGRAPFDCDWTRDFAGELDDVRIYDRALSAGEISAFIPSVETTTAISIEEPVINWNRWTNATVTVDPAPVQSATVRIFDVSDGGHSLVAEWGTDIATGVARVQLVSSETGLDVGTYELVAETDTLGPYGASSSTSTPFEVVKFENDVSLESDVQNVNPGATALLTGTVSVYTDGIATFYEDHGEGIVESIGTAPLVFTNGPYKATIETPSLALGDHSFLMRISETDHFAARETAPVVIHVAQRGSETLLAVDGVPQAHHPQQLYASILPVPRTGLASLPAPSGTIMFRDGTTLLGAVATEGTGFLEVPSLSVGSHSITAEYSGDAFYGGSTSAPTIVTIGADVVEATGVGINYGTFYPYKDGYRDVVDIRGTRTEPISVVIGIYSPSGTRVKLTSIPGGTGAYRYAWNGRNSSGSMLASGKYKIVQVLKDTAGTSISVTSYTTLSQKRLVYTTTYVTKNGSSISSYGDAGGGSISVSTSTGVAKLIGKYPYGWVGVGYQLTLPSAVVYKSIAFQAYTKGALAVPPSEIAIQNFNSCPYSSVWDVSCFDRWHSAVATTNVTSWVSTSGHPSFHRSGRTVRGLVSVPFGTLYVYKVRVKVTYGVLK
jgi:hypothetical protein